jgi:transketolase
MALSRKLSSLAPAVKFTCVEAYEQLKKKASRRVVSMPCAELFEQQANLSG